MKSLCFVLPLALLATACASVPKPRNLVGAKPDAAGNVDVSRTLVVRIACELDGAAQATKDRLFERKMTKGKPATATEPAVPPKPYAAYDIVVQLTYKADTAGKVAPTLNFIDTFGGNDDTRTAIFGFSLKRGRTQEITENFSIDGLSMPGQFGKESDECKKAQRDVAGEFGLKELVDQRFGRSLPKGIEGAGTKDDEFKSTITFTLTKGGSGGPHWETKHFKGPSGDGLLSGERTDTNELVISFASHDEAAPEGAQTKARQGITDSILRSLQRERR